MSNTKSLIIYFSRADENYFGGEIKSINKGNTEVIAEYIKEFTGADMFKVEPLVKYSEKYMICIDQAKERIKTHAAPIKEKVPDISKYEVIYIGAPIYWGKMPEELATALQDLNFEGKIVKPFVTHEGSGISQVPQQLQKLCTGAKISDGLEIFGSKVERSKSDVKNWI